MDADALAFHEEYLRAMIAGRDALVNELARLDAKIAAAARAYADAQGVKPKPSIDQLRRQLTRNDQTN